MSPPRTPHSQSSTVTTEKNGWDEWAKHVLSELERLNDCVVLIQESVNSLKVDIATQRVKVGLVATILGVVGGILPVVVLILIEYVFRKP